MRDTQKLCKVLYHDNAPCGKGSASPVNFCAKKFTVRQHAKPNEVSIFCFGIEMAVLQKPFATALVELDVQRLSPASATRAAGLLSRSVPSGLALDCRYEFASY